MHIGYSGWVIRGPHRRVRESRYILDVSEVLISFGIEAKASVPFLTLRSQSTKLLSSSLSKVERVPHFSLIFSVNSKSLQFFHKYELTMHDHKLCCFFAFCITGCQKSPPRTTVIPPNCLFSAFCLVPDSISLRARSNASKQYL
jgi:hypothetical protein